MTIRNFVKAPEFFEENNSVDADVSHRLVQRPFFQSKKFTSPFNPALHRQLLQLGGSTSENATDENSVDGRLDSDFHGNDCASQNAMSYHMTGDEGRLSGSAVQSRSNVGPTIYNRTVPYPDNSLGGGTAVPSLCGEVVVKPTRSALNKASQKSTDSLVGEAIHHATGARIPAKRTSLLCGKVAAPESHDVGRLRGTVHDERSLIEGRKREKRNVDQRPVIIKQIFHKEKKESPLRRPYENRPNRRCKEDLHSRMEALSDRRLLDESSARSVSSGGELLSMKTTPSVRTKETDRYRTVDGESRKDSRTEAEFCCVNEKNRHEEEPPDRVATCSQFFMASTIGSKETRVDETSVMTVDPLEKWMMASKGENNLDDNRIFEEIREGLKRSVESAKEPSLTQDRLPQNLEDWNEQFDSLWVGGGSSSEQVGDSDLSSSAWKCEADERTRAPGSNLIETTGDSDLRTRAPELSSSNLSETISRSDIKCYSDNASEKSSLDKPRLSLSAAPSVIDVLDEEEDGEEISPPKKYDHYASLTDQFVGNQSCGDHELAGSVKRSFLSVLCEENACVVQGKLCVGKLLPLEKRRKSFCVSGDEGGASGKSKEDLKSREVFQWMLMSTAYCAILVLVLECFYQRLWPKLAVLVTGRRPEEVFADDIRDPYGILKEDNSRSEVDAEIKTDNDESSWLPTRWLPTNFCGLPPWLQWITPQFTWSTAVAATLTVFIAARLMVIRRLVDLDDDDDDGGEEGNLLGCVHEYNEEDDDWEEPSKNEIS